MWPYMGSMGWWMVLWWGFGLVVLALLAWVIAKTARGFSMRSGETPEQILKRRYARGEIDRDDYQRRLEDVRR